MVKCDYCDEIEVEEAGDLCEGCLDKLSMEEYYMEAETEYLHGEYGQFNQKS